MKTILRNLCLTSFALISAGQASAVPVVLDTLVHVGDKFSIAELSRGLAGDYFVESSDVNVVKIDNDSVYVTASYYDGNGEYAEKQASLLLYNAATNIPLAGVNVKVAPEARLSEAKTYTNPTDLQMESIEFTRTFKDNSVNTWQTIYLPFAIDIEAHADEFSVARLYGYDYIRDTNKDGIVGKGDSMFVIQKIATSGITNPNEPLLVRPNHAGEITFRAANNTLAAAKRNIIKMADTEFYNADKIYEIVCTYDVDTLKPGGNNFYIAANGKFSMRTATGTSLNYVPYRWYIHADSKTDEVFESYDASGLRHTVANANFETAKKIETVYVKGDREFDVDKFCYYVNCAPFEPLSSIESSDEQVAWIESGAVRTCQVVFDGHEDYLACEKRCKLTLRTEFGSVTVVNLVVTPNVAKLSEAKTYTTPERMHFDTVEFTRTFKANSVDTWQTIYLPFAFNIEEHSNDLSVARYFGYGPYRDTNGDGVINSSDSSFVVFKKATSGITDPNEPLLVSPKYAGDITIRADYDYNTNSEFLYPAERKIEVVKDTTDRTFQIVCTYDVDTLQPGGNNFYVAANGKISMRTATGTSLNYIPYRWYYHVDSKTGEVFESYEASALRHTVKDESFEFPKEEVKEEISEDTTVVTSIKLIECDNIKEQVIYNINGVKFESLDNAPAGIYIINGKKIIINKNN